MKADVSLTVDWTDEEPFNEHNFISRHAKLEKKFHRPGKCNYLKMKLEKENYDVEKIL